MSLLKKLAIKTALEVDGADYVLIIILKDTVLKAIIPNVESQEKQITERVTS